MMVLLTSPPVFAGFCQAVVMVPLQTEKFSNVFEMKISDKNVLNLSNNFLNEIDFIILQFIL